MAVFDRPSAISASTSVSRGVSRPSGVGFAAAGQELADNLRVEHHAAVRDPLECPDELPDVGYPVFEQVPDLVGVAGEELAGVAFLDELREHDQGDRRPAAADLDRRAQALRRCRRGACGRR